MHDTDRVERAAEVIDRDPEQAQATLQAAAAPGTQVTMADVMDLMRGMQQMVQTVLSSQQQQIEDLKQANRKPGEKTPWTEEDLQRLNDQERYLREYWAAEPHVPFYVQPTAEEIKMRESVKAREFPKRPFEVNGVKFWLSPGKQPPDPIPLSIAAVLQEQQEGYRPIHNDAPQPLDEIPRPPRAYLATEAGRPGNLGEGPLSISPAPAEPIGAR